MFKFPIQNKISIKHSIKWGFISILYNFLIFFSVFLTSNILGYKSFIFKDKFDINQDLWLRLIDILFIAPIIESLLISLALIWISKILKNGVAVHFSVSILFGLMHLPSGTYSHAFMIAFIFQIQLYYLYRRKEIAKFSTLTAEGAIMHTMHNIVVYIFTYYRILH